MSETVPDPTLPDSTSNLGRWLGYGAFAALAAAVLGVTGSALTLGGWPPGRFSLPEIIGRTALLPLAVVLVAYYKASLATGAVGLRRSAVGSFGMLVILELADLNLNEDGPRWWNVAIWVALALATVVLLLVAWNLPDFEQAGATGNPAGSAPPVAADPSGGKSTGAAIAGFGLFGLLALRLALKLASIQVMKAVGADGLEALAMLVGVVLAAVFLVWFAVAKIRLRHALGPLAAAVGAVELLALLLFGLLTAGMLADLFQAVEQAGLDEQAAEANVKVVEATWTARGEWASIAVGVVWAALTAGLFLNYRGRLDAERRESEALPG